MKHFVEVSNAEFDEAHDIHFGNDNIYGAKNFVFGTDYGTSYETLDKSAEYGHMIFKTKQEAEVWHGQTFKEAVK